MGNPQKKTIILGSSCFCVCGANTRTLMTEIIRYSSLLSTISATITEKLYVYAQIARRDVYYTQLLGHHIKLTHTRGIFKEIHKWLFFWLIIAACFFGGIIVYRIFDKIFSVEDYQFIISAIPLIVTALISFVSTIIVIPVTITKFLFNTKEDDNITTLIEHTQDHDTSGMNFFKERINSKRNKMNYETIKGDEEY